MAFEIIVAPQTVVALKKLAVPVRRGVEKALDLHLTREPAKVVKSRIKKLRGLRQPQYRLRVGDIRVLHDVTETQVQVLAVVSKAEAHAWLDERGQPRRAPGKNGGAGVPLTVWPEFVRRCVLPQAVDQALAQFHTPSNGCEPARMRLQAENTTKTTLHISESLSAKAAGGLEQGLAIDGDDLRDVRHRVLR
jgi:mRNA interferase RelE/StbE